jgi:uncharacterized membrane protein YfcA
MRNLIVLAFVGLLAQLVDGSLGMAYGVTSSSLMLATGIAPAAASAAVHLSEVGTTLASGAAHWRFGNIDWRVVSIMAIPGGVSAFLGATYLSSLPGDEAKPWVSLLLLSLGVYVVYRFLRLGGQRPTFRRRPHKRFLIPLAAVAGTMDAIGGGGWGPVGTSSLLASGRLEPRKVVGSIDTAEFVVAVGASLGFLIGLGSAGIDFAWVGALLVGGVLAAPFAAYLVRHLPARVLGTAAGGLIILTNVKTVLESSLVGLPKDSTTVWSIVGLLAIVWISLIVAAVQEERVSRRSKEPVVTSA